MGLLQGNGKAFTCQSLSSNLEDFVFLSARSINSGVKELHSTLFRVLMLSTEAG